MSRSALTPHDHFLFCYGDSLSLPRPGNGIHLEDTYVELFAAASPPGITRVFNRSMGGFGVGNISQYIGREFTYFEQLQPEITTLLQLGIVDCAPRPLPKVLRIVVVALPSRFGQPIKSFLHHNRPRIQALGLRWRYTKPRRFDRKFRQLLVDISRFSQAIYVLNICPTSIATAKHSPGLRQSIVLYNSLISRAVERSPGRVHLVDIHEVLSTDTERSLLADGIHLSRHGHAMIFDALLAAYRAAVPETAE